jgi:hypothetical protein
MSMKNTRPEAIKRQETLSALSSEIDRREMRISELKRCEYFIHILLAEEEAEIKKLNAAFGDVRVEQPEGMNAEN